MKLIYLLLLSAIFCTSASATDTVRKARPNEPYNAIKLGATTVSVLIPMVQLGYEHRWNKYSWLAGTGFVLPRRYNIDNTLRGIATGFTLRFDGRLHNYTPDHSGVYFGLGLFYNWFKYPHVEYFGDSLDWATRYAGKKDEYLLIKSTVGCVLQFGGHHYIGKRFDIDMSIGLGPKVMFTKQRGRTDPSEYVWSRHPNIHMIESRLGTEWAVALQAQVSVGYIFGK